MDPYFHQIPWEIIEDDKGEVIGVVYRVLGGERNEVNNQRGIAKPKRNHQSIKTTLRKLQQNEGRIHGVSGMGSEDAKDQTD